MNFVDELKWRGMIHDIMPGTEDLLNKGMVTGYIGFDPTSDSLGVGNLVQIMTLLHFQRAGHKPIALVGGATGMVGDPSGKSAERNLLDEKTLQHNLDCQRKQLEKFLDFNAEKNAAEIVNNYDWFKDFTFLDFIRDVGKHISINYMLAKDSVKSRLETGMSFTEFSYQLVQGFDFFHLYHHHGVKLQMGGSDQWGNIVTGTELLRRKSGVNDAFALTTPLIAKADGTKFGKTESGNVWLDPKKTSPSKFYQFWLNASDDDVKNFIKIFSLKTREEIEALETEHFRAPHLRLLQRNLAEEITLRVHGKDGLNQATEETKIAFPTSEDDIIRNIEKIDTENIPEIFQVGVVSGSTLNSGINVLDILVGATGSCFFPSKNEAKKMILNNGLSINGSKVTDTELLINSKDLINGKFIYVQKGKKSRNLIKPTFNIVEKIIFTGKEKDTFIQILDEKIIRLVVKEKSSGRITKGRDLTKLEKDDFMNEKIRLDVEKGKIFFGKIKKGWYYDKELFPNEEILNSKISNFCNSHIK